LPSIAVNAQGKAEWEYTIPMEMKPGEYEFQASFPNQTRFPYRLDFSDTTPSVYCNVLQNIRNLRVSPESFDQRTTVYFDLKADMRVQVDIFANANFSGLFSHRRRLRSYADGVLQKNDNVSIHWDGKNDNGNPTWRGHYVCRVSSEHGDFQHITNLEKTGGKIL
jgi:hypothetical protein